MGECKSTLLSYDKKNIIFDDVHLTHFVCVRVCVCGWVGVDRLSLMLNKAIVWELLRVAQTETEKEQKNRKKDASISMIVGNYLPSICCYRCYLKKRQTIRNSVTSYFHCKKDEIIR